MRPARALVVMADDFGMGPGTTQGILDLAARRRVSGSVLLVNSPYAEAGVRAWRRAGCPMELGWHPTLTSDAPILPARRVQSLIGADGAFCRLAAFIRRKLTGRIVAAEVCAELQAQYQRFCELVGQAPRVVNSHQHVALFRPVGLILLEILRRQRPLPYVRRVQEPWRMLWRIPGARVKRSFLSCLGKPLARVQRTLGFAGNDWLAGITDPRWVKDPRYLQRWLSRVPGDVVELACHPGYLDPTLIGRDCSATDGLLQRRVDEWTRLHDPAFPETCAAAGFALAAPSDVVHFQEGRAVAA
jgi:predicted glycoside hydrolase/deacetylase ChbG (UPF0249 family)